MFIGSSIDKKQGSKLLVSLPDGYHLYGFLNTGVARLLIERSSCDCCFIIPPESDCCIPEDLRTRAEWLMSPMYKLSSLGRLFRYLRREASAHLRTSTSWKLVRRKHYRSYKHMILRLIAAALYAVPRLEKALIRIERLVAPSPMREILGWSSFATVVLGSAGLKDLDIAVLQVFHQLPVKTYGIVYSWDNISSKLNYMTRFDRVAVWNDVMKGELVRDLGYREDQVAVVGAPQFDIYYAFSPKHSREDFLLSLGFPSNARYILYSGVPKSTSPWGPEYVLAILNAIPDKYVLVRPHPQDSENAYHHLEGLSRVRIIHPGRKSHSNNRVLGFWLPKEEEGNSLAEQIYYADAVANVASTVTLEALLLNTPTVNIAFDGLVERFPVTMSEYYSTEHYSLIANSGVVPIVYSAGELAIALQSIQDWWPGKGKLHDGLKKVIDPFQDGKAAIRLAQDIIDLHNHRSPGSSSLRIPG